MRTAVLWAVILLLSVAGAVGLPRAAAGQSDGFAADVAARCGGEARWAIALCSCVVRNRLSGGWSQARVLDAFYAPDITPTAAEVDLAGRVLNGNWPCDPRLWYQFGAADLAPLGLEPGAAIITSERGGWVALFYGKDALK